MRSTRIALGCIRRARTNFLELRRRLIDGHLQPCLRQGAPRLSRRRCPADDRHAGRRTG